MKAHPFTELVNQIDARCRALPEADRTAILKLAQAAYWLGARDALTEPASVPVAADRRSDDRPANVLYLANAPRAGRHRPLS